MLRVSGDRLLGGVIADSDVREFGLADGLASVECVRRNKSVVADQLGRIWLSAYKGLSVVDPARAEDVSVPALVLVEGITLDGIPGDIQDCCSARTSPPWSRPDVLHPPGARPQTRSGPKIPDALYAFAADP